MIPDFMTPHDIAAKMKFKLDWVYERLEKGEFPGAIKIGRKWRIPPQAVQDYIRKNDEARLVGRAA